MKAFKQAVCTLLALTMFYATPVSAIVIRHDVPDEKYLELGAQYPSFVFFGCGSTLIASNYILTAAHCVGVQPSYLSVGENRCQVAEVIVHPQSVVSDLALFRLSSHVTDIEPVKLYRGSDEQDQIAVLVGRGGTGNGKEGTIIDDGQLRGARNKIDLVNNLVIGFEMNAPSTALDLEGVGGPGDSGGPAYIETDEGLFIAGVSSYGEWLYGDFDHYARVSTHADWIEQTMKETNALAEEKGTASTGECEKE
jgi:hypothetical protein